MFRPQRHHRSQDSYCISVPHVGVCKDSEQAAPLQAHRHANIEESLGPTETVCSSCKHAYPKTVVRHSIKASCYWSVNS